MRQTQLQCQYRGGFYRFALDRLSLSEFSAKYTYTDYEGVGNLEPIVNTVKFLPPSQVE